MPQENKSRYAILGLLSLRSMSGYELKKMIEESTYHFWREHFPQIYPMLKQLETEGLTISHAQQQEGRPERHVYTLTDKGWETLQQWLALPPVLQVERNELLLKLFFGSQVTQDVSVTHLQQFKEDQLMQIAVLEQKELSLQKEFANNRHLPYWLSTTSYGLYVKRALVAWCDEVLTQFQHVEQDGE